MDFSFDAIHSNDHLLTHRNSEGEIPVIFLNTLLK